MIASERHQNLNSIAAAVFAAAACLLGSATAQEISWRKLFDEVDEHCATHDFEAATRTLNSFEELLRASDPPQYELDWVAVAMSDVAAMAGLSETLLDSLDLARELGDEISSLRRQMEFTDVIERSGRRIALLESLFGERAIRESVLAWTDLASAHLQLGQFEEAERAARLALSIRERLYRTDNPRLATSIKLVSDALQYQGRYLEAEALLQGALAMLRRTSGSESRHVGAYLSELGNIHLEQGNFDAARDDYEECLRVTRTGYGEDHFYVGYAVRSLGELAEAEGRLDEAEAGYRESLRIIAATLGEDDFRLANSLELLGRLLADRGELEEAESLLTRAFQLREAQYGRGAEITMTTLIYLGRVASLGGNTERAERLYTEALAAIERRFGSRHIMVLGAKTLLGQSCASRGDYEQARKWLIEAADGFEAARIRAGRGIDRATARLISPYRSLAATWALAGRAREAWMAYEAAQARSLAERIHGQGDRGRTESEREARRELSVAETQLTRLLDAEDVETASSQEALEAARTRLYEAESRWADVQAELISDESDLGVRPFTLERIQAGLDPSTAIVGWLEVEQERGGGSWAWVLRNPGGVQWLDLGPPNLGGSQLERLRSAWSVKRSRDWADHAVASAELEQRLFGPLRGALEGIDAIEIVLSEELLGFPVEALTDSEGQTLLERSTVSYIPSATVRTILHERRSAAGTRERTDALLVGDPPFNERHRAMASPHRGAEPLRSAEEASEDRWGREQLGRLPRLPGSGREVERVAALFDEATVLLGTDASEPRLSDLANSGALMDFDVIHLATHALVDDRSPERSALVFSQLDLPDPFEQTLAGRPAYDGLLDAGEISRQWNLDAELVALSACETGLGRHAEGEGYLGLVDAFLQAGARGLLVSLWRVDDEATESLMSRFYANLVGAGNAPAVAPARALREAKLWLRQQSSRRGASWNDPHYWAGFVLIGASD